jgi:hypothetical protein
MQVERGALLLAQPAFFIRAKGSWWFLVKSTTSRLWFCTSCNCCWKKAASSWADILVLNWSKIWRGRSVLVTLVRDDLYSCEEKDGRESSKTKLTLPLIGRDSDIFILYEGLSIGGRSLGHKTRWSWQCKRACIWSRSSSLRAMLIVTNTRTSHAVAYTF